MYLVLRKFERRVALLFVDAGDQMTLCRLLQATFSKFHPLEEYNTWTIQHVTRIVNGRLNELCFIENENNDEVDCCFRQTEKRSHLQTSFDVIVFLRQTGANEIPSCKTKLPINNSSEFLRN